jgi:protein-S-isoprenylcysteine O-methyltransferase Ste14
MSVARPVTASYARRMTKNRAFILPAVLLGVALIVVAAIYFVEPARSLPSFFPGHAVGSVHHHVKHGIAALVLALACLVFAWFQTGPSRAATA